jgi:Fe-S cluster biogenesis protein NfuA
MALKRKEVETVIKERLDPLFSLDGGSLEVARVDPGEGVVRVRFTGSYEACPSRDLLLSRVVEPTLKRDIPGIKRVKLD